MPILPSRWDRIRGCVGGKVRCPTCVVGMVHASASSLLLLFVPFPPRTSIRPGSLRGRPLASPRGDPPTFLSDGCIECAPPTWFAHTFVPGVVVGSRLGIPFRPVRLGRGGRNTTFNQACVPVRFPSETVTMKPRKGGKGCPFGSPPPSIPLERMGRSRGRKGTQAIPRPVGVEKRRKMDRGADG